MTSYDPRDIPRLSIVRRPKTLEEMQAYLDEPNPFFLDWKGQPISPRTFERMKTNKAEAVVAQTQLWNGLWVSTVWLGVDHSFARAGRSIIFESMVFEGWRRTGFSVDQMRYATADEARKGHEALCKRWRRSYPRWLGLGRLARLFARE